VPREQPPSAGGCGRRAGGRSVSRKACQQPSLCVRPCCAQQPPLNTCKRCEVLKICGVGVLLAHSPLGV
jgi:hypothetical protein